MLQRTNNTIDPAHLITLFGLIGRDEFPLETEEKIEDSVLENFLNSSVDMFLTKDSLPNAGEILIQYFNNCLAKNITPHLDENESLAYTIDFAIRLSLLSNDEMSALLEKKPQLNQQFLYHVRDLHETLKPFFVTTHLRRKYFY